MPTAFLLLLILPVATSKWDDIFHQITPVCIDGRIVCGTAAQKDVNIDIYEHDVFKDDFVSSTKSGSDGRFHVCGEARDWKTAPDPELYMTFYDACNKACQRIDLNGIPVNEDGSIEQNFEDIDLSGNDEYLQAVEC